MTGLFQPFHLAVTGLFLLCNPCLLLVGIIVWLLALSFRNGAQH